MARKKTSVRLGEGYLEALSDCISDVSCGAALRISARPKSSNESLSICAAHGLVLKIRAPATEGQANARVVEVLAAMLNTRKSDLEIKSGETSRNKTIHVHGASAEICRASLVAGADLQV